MSLIDQITGKQPVGEDLPMQAARTRPASMLRKEEPKDKEEKKLRDKARRTSVVAHILGMAESDEEGIIPADAKRVDPFSTSQIPGMKETPTLDNTSPSEPALTTAHGEELIPPTAALVAPDVTPKVFQLIDPSQVPAPPVATDTPPGPPTVGPESGPQRGVMDTILGRENTGGPPPGTPPVATESFLQAISPLEIKSRVAEKLVPATAGGSAMPEHKEGDGRTIFNVARTLMG